MEHSRPSAAMRRLPRRSHRLQALFVGITLVINAVFWSAIYWARRDPDPLLYERLVPVTIVLPKKDQPTDRTTASRSPAARASNAGP